MAAAACPRTSASPTPTPTRARCASPTVPTRCTATRSQSSSSASRPASPTRCRRCGNDEQRRLIVGVPREVKTHEYRVGLTPTSVRELISHKHQVIIEKGAGLGIGAPDSAYEKAGARVVEDIFPFAELIVKVKEPQPAERKRLRESQVLFTYLHLAPDPEQTRDLLKSNAVCIAY